jgi:hypothetical protein
MAINPKGEPVGPVAPNGPGAWGQAPPPAYTGGLVATTGMPSGKQIFSTAS